MDSIGIIGLVAGLWFALSPAGDQRRPAPVWLCWLLAGTATVLLLAGTLTEPLDPRGDSSVGTDWTGPTSDSTEQGDVGGSGDSPLATPSASGAACTLNCG